MKRTRWTTAAILAVALAAPRSVFAQASAVEIDRLQVKYNLAKSDYLEAIATCNGALRKSAERQMDRILSDLSRMKDRAQKDYETMSRNLNNIYRELTPYFDSPNAAKTFLDMAMNYVPVIGNAYSITNSIYDYADKHVQSQKGKEIFGRARRQIEEMDKVSREYKDWMDFERDVQKTKAELARRFDKECRGRDTGEWRYDDVAVRRQTGEVDTAFHGRDAASGEVFQGDIVNKTGEDVVVGFPPGTVVYPDDPGSQRMMLTGGPRVTVPPGETVSVPLDGFCLDPRLYPPSPTDSPDGWFPAPPPVIVPDGNPFTPESAGIPSVPGIVPGMIENGEIPPTGLPPGMEQETITQWSIWNMMGGFDPDDGEKKITEQVRESGGTQTPEQIHRLNENIWAGVDLVRKRTRGEGGAGPRKGDGR